MATLNYVIDAKQTIKKVTLVPSDPNSRYKTHQLQIQMTGKNQMTKMVFSNLSQVAKDMKIPGDYLLKYLSYVLGTQAQYDSKNSNLSYLKGRYDNDKLSTTVIKFIRNFILCPRCDLPELSYLIRSSYIRGVCRACGGREKLELEGKFKQYVINHPPSNSSAEFKLTVASVTPNKKKHQIKEELSNDTNEVNNGEDADEIDWLVDTSKEAVEERQMIPETISLLIKK